METETKTAFAVADCDGDTLEVRRAVGSADMFVRVSGEAQHGVAYLTTEQVRELVGFLLDFLNDAGERGFAPECAGEDCEGCGDGIDGTTFERVPFHRRDESSIASEAHAAVYGDREGDYGHPREDFTRTALLWTGLLQHKLKPGECIEPEDIARCMIGVKLSRDVHCPKRDNQVDGIGYFITLDRLETGR